MPTYNVPPAVVARIQAENQKQNTYGDIAIQLFHNKNSELRKL